MQAVKNVGCPTLTSRCDPSSGHSRSVTVIPIVRNRPDYFLKDSLRRSMAEHVGPALQ